MIVVAAVAIVLNGFISFVLRKDAHHDLNVKSAYLHMLGDMLSAIGVIIAGVVIHYTSSKLADPVASFLIGGLILYSSWSVLVEAVNVLLEGVPPSIVLSEVEAAIEGVDGVLDVHDLHVWSVSSGILAASCHIEVSEQTIQSGQQILQSVTLMLKERYGIGHTTIQVEVEGCDPNDLYCTLTHLRSAKK
jgi:cobalt-zinc-cadmium efflux system protein